MFSDNTPLDDQDLPELPIAMTTSPGDFEGEYQQFADDFWLLTDFLFSSEGTVAYLSWEGDRPGGADDGYIERYEDRYVFWISGVDIWEYLGRFPKTADAVESWIDRFLQADYPPRISFKEENWIGPVPS